MNLFYFPHGSFPSVGSLLWVVPLVWEAANSHVLRWKSHKTNAAMKILKKTEKKGGLRGSHQLSVVGITWVAFLLKQEALK